MKDCSKHFCFFSFFFPVMNYVYVYSVEMNVFTQCLLSCMSNQCVLRKKKRKTLFN